MYIYDLINLMKISQSSAAEDPNDKFREFIINYID